MKICAQLRDAFGSRMHTTHATQVYHAGHACHHSTFMLNCTPIINDQRPTTIHDAIIVHSMRGFGSFGGRFGLARQLIDVKIRQSEHLDENVDLQREQVDFLV
jgi:hypothetical protein